MEQVKYKLSGRGSSGPQAESSPDTYSSVVNNQASFTLDLKLHFTLQFAFIYIFNLVIGVGALALPKSFSEAGLILGTILLVVLAFVSYMTATFMVEAMATANAYVRHKARQGQGVVEAQSKGIQSSHGKNNTDYVSGK